MAMAPRTTRRVSLFESSNSGTSDRARRRARSQDYLRGLRDQQSTSPTSASSGEPYRNARGDLVGPDLPAPEDTRPYGSDPLDDPTVTDPDEQRRTRRSRTHDQEHLNQVEFGSGGTMQFQPAPAIPALPPIDPEILAELLARERAAKRAVQEAEIAAQAGRERSGLDFGQFIRELGSRRDLAIGGLRGEAASRNLAFQPAFLGIGLRDIRNQTAEAEGRAAQSRAVFLAGIERQISQAQQARDAELAAIARDRARLQGNPDQFLGNTPA